MQSQSCGNVHSLISSQIALLTGRVYQDSLGGLQAVRLFFRAASVDVGRDPDFEVWVSEAVNSISLQRSRNVCRTNL
jgi:hypothetical protein